MSSTDEHHQIDSPPSRIFDFSPPKCQECEADEDTESEPDLDEEENRQLPSWLNDDKLRSVVQGSIDADLFEGRITTDWMGMSNSWEGKKNGTFRFGEKDEDKTHRLDFHISILQWDKPLDRARPPPIDFSLRCPSDIGKDVDRVVANVRAATYDTGPRLDVDVKVASAEQNVLDLKATWWVELTERKCGCQ